MPDQFRSSTEEHLDELAQLIDTAGGSVAARVVARRPAPDAATWIGSGKAEEIGQIAAREKASLVVFDDDLSPAQARNLETIIGIRVIDRSALILDIFAGRARSREAKTQVELAQLEYRLPRLAGQWKHLERQAGGIGTRGVGETQLEIDRRIVRRRISQLEGELEKIERTRQTQRKARRGSAFTVALVGYTNAGKSTLFNALTGGEAWAADKLFATLDAKSQRAAFPMPRRTVIIDTVGFIRKLPHDLVASFRSTMEEAVTADLVLHVIDSSHPQLEEQRAVGEEVLRELGIPPERVVDVYNKIDVIPSRGDGEGSPSKRRGFLAALGMTRVSLSALTAEGIDHLLEIIREHELAGGEVVELEIPNEEGRLLALLHQVAEVYEERSDDRGTALRAWIPRSSLHVFKQFSLSNLQKRAKVS